MLCVKELATGGSHRDVDVGTNVNSLVVHGHLPKLMS